jgi:hypothetical protein
MAGIHELIDWYEAERDRLKRKIELMESGRWRCETPDANGKFVDSTSQELDSCRHRLAQVERLIKRHESKPDEGIRPEDLNSENDG